jgi:hypothetical protein
VGIDPGTTLGYSVLDINANVIEIGSSKLLCFDSLVARLTKFGKVVIVGTDKQKTPSFVDRLKRKLGAKLVRPQEDLKVAEKNRLAFGYTVKNNHERDALSSAVFSYKKLKTLFSRIDSFLGLCDKGMYGNQVKELLLRKSNLNLPLALELAEGNVLKEKK